MIALYFQVRTGQVSTPSVSADSPGLGGRGVPIATRGLGRSAAAQPAPQISDQLRTF